MSFGLMPLIHSVVVQEQVLSLRNNRPSFACCCAFHFLVSSILAILNSVNESKQGSVIKRLNCKETEGRWPWPSMASAVAGVGPIGKEVKKTRELVTARPWGPLGRVPRMVKVEVGWFFCLHRDLFAGPSVKFKFA